MAQKSKDITKYNIDWQIVRVQAKKYKDIATKINYVLEFYKKHNTIDNHERIINWLEGLAMGYKNPHDKAMILGTKVLFEPAKTKEKIINDPEEIQKLAYDGAKNYNPVFVKECFMDNFARFKKWSSEGYIHEELFQFTYGLLKYLVDHKIPMLRNKTTLEDLANMHLNGTIAPNNYKFKFK
jgi:hypothetical protein